MYTLISTAIHTHKYRYTFTSTVHTHTLTVHTHTLTVHVHTHTYSQVQVHTHTKLSNSVFEIAPQPPPSGTLDTCKAISKFKHPIYRLSFYS